MNTRALTHYPALAAEAAMYRREQDHAEQPFPRWMFWAFAICYSLVLTFASYEFARVLPVLRGMLP